MYFPAFPSCFLAPSGPQGLYSGTSPEMPWPCSCFVTYRDDPVYLQGTLENGPIERSSDLLIKWAIKQTIHCWTSDWWSKWETDFPSLPGHLPSSTIILHHLPGHLPSSPRLSSFTSYCITNLLMIDQFNWGASELNWPNKRSYIIFQVFFHHQGHHPLLSRSSSIIFQVFLNC